MSAREAFVWLAAIAAIAMLVAGRAYCAEPAAPSVLSGGVERVLPDDPRVRYPTHGLWTTVEGERLTPRCPLEVPAAGEVPLPEGCPAPAPAWLVTLELRSALAASLAAADGRLRAEEQRADAARDATARAVRACEVRLRRCAEGARILAAASDGDTPRTVWLAGGLGALAGAAVALAAVWLGGGL